MTITGHKLVGLAVGIGVAGLMKAGHPAFSLWWLAVILPASIAGSGFPDRIEWGFWGGRWIAHRTWTHWWPLWVVPLVMLYWPGIPAVDGWHPVVVAGLTAFFAGGVSHLLADLPNPSGIPGLTPHRPVSLYWWESGANEWWLVPIMLAAPIPLWWMEIQAGTQVVLHWSQTFGIA